MEVSDVPKGVLAEHVAADAEEVPSTRVRNGSGASGLVRDGTGVSGLVRDGSGVSGLVRGCDDSDSVGVDFQTGEQGEDDTDTVSEH